MYVFQLFIGKYRAVFTGVKFADTAMSAFPQAAGHTFFHRQVYIRRLKPQIQQFQGYKFHHNRRAADYGYGIGVIYPGII